MGQQESAQFEEVIASFLNNALAKMQDFDDAPDGAPQILGVEVDSQDILEKSTSRMSKPERTRQSQRVWNWMSSFFGDDENEEEGTRFLQSSSSIEIVTTITGQYRAPPKINFPALVEDSIDTGSSELKRELKENQLDDNGEVYGGYFDEISDVTSRPVNPIILLEQETTSPPTTAPSDKSPTHLGKGNYFTITISLIGGFVLLFACILFLILLKRRRMKTDSICDESDERLKRQISSSRTESVRSNSDRSVGASNCEIDCNAYGFDSFRGPNPTSAFTCIEERREGSRNGSWRDKKGSIRSIEMEKERSGRMRAQGDSFRGPIPVPAFTRIEEGREGSRNGSWRDQKRSIR
eukprot:562838-Ditylum_brightwellii.AAC.1